MSNGQFPLNTVNVTKEIGISTWYQNQIFNDSACIIGYTSHDCQMNGKHGLLTVLVVSQSISSFILIYFFAKFARNFFINPTNANRKMASLVIPGILYSLINVFFCYFSNYEISIQYLYIISMALRCFTYIVAANQVIFLIRVNSPIFGAVLHFIMVLIGLVNSIFIIAILVCVLTMHHFENYEFYIFLVIESLSILLYTFVCVHVFVFSNEVEWIVSPGYCKKMKIIIFVNSLFSFFSIAYKIIFHSGDYLLMPYIMFVLLGWEKEKRRNFNFFLFFLQKFVFGNLPVLLVVIAMIYMKPNDNVANGDKTEPSENTSKAMLHSDLVDP